MKSRYHRLNAWRGYSIPGPAVMGASDTGMASDSPCPSDEVKAEVKRFQKECLIPAGIKSRTRFGGSSNVFCGKRWVCVSKADWPKAAALALEWLDDNNPSLHYLHDADQKAAS